MNQLTFKLNSGAVVLAKMYRGEIRPFTFVNRTQAENAARKAGEGWAVIQRGRPFYVAQVTPMTLDQITNRMQLLEIEINREQPYIAEFGERNDADSDGQWESYKTNADYNLRQWDAMKAQRDTLKKEVT